MHNDLEQEGVDSHPYRDEESTLTQNGEEGSHAPHDLSMIEEVSSDVERSPGRQARDKGGWSKSKSPFFETFPSDEDDVFVETGNGALDALRAGNLQRARNQQQASPSGRIVQRRYAGRFSFYGDDDDFASEAPPRLESSLPKSSTFVLDLPAPRDAHSSRASRRASRRDQTPTKGRRGRFVIHSELTTSEKHRPSAETASKILKRDSPMVASHDHSRGNSDASTLRMGNGIYPPPLNTLDGLGSRNDEEHSIQYSEIISNTNGNDDVQRRRSRSNASSCSKSTVDGILPSEEEGSRMSTPVPDNVPDSVPDNESQSDNINFSSWRTSSEVALPQLSLLPPAIISTRRGPFEWSPGKQHLVRRDGDLQFEQTVDTPLLVPGPKSARNQGGPHGFGNNIYPEEWVEAGELGEGLYPPGNHHGLSDPFSSSSAVSHVDGIVDGVAGLKVAIVDNAFTPEALRRGQPGAQAAAQRNRLLSPFYNHLQQLAVRSRSEDTNDEAFEVGRRAGSATSDDSDSATLYTQNGLLPEAIESPTAHVLQEYETSSEDGGIDQDSHLELSLGYSECPTRDGDLMEHSTQTDAPVAMGGYTFNTRDWGDYGSALVDHAPEKAAPKIPGCTAGQASNKNWKLTGPVLQAYNAMRGSRMAAGDPMGTWVGVKLQEGLMKESPEGKGKEQAPDFNVRDLQKFTAEIAETLQERPSIDKAARQEVASVPRPQYQHINPPKGFKYPAHLASSIHGIASESFDRNFKEEYDISDDEGDPRAGRISPCTFRALAEGCTRWEEPGKELIHMPSDTKRLRPKTPPGGSQPQMPPDRMAHNFTWQKDIEDGDALSPMYSLPSKPSIIYTPPGLHPKAQIRNWSTNMYDRMDPLMAKRLRDAQDTDENDADAQDAGEAAAPPASTPPTASSENRPYTQTEVAAALTSPQSRTLAGIPASAAEGVVAQRWQTVGLWRAQEETLARRCDAELTPQLAATRAQLRSVRAGVDAILAAREAAASSRLARQNRRILRQVSGHLKDVKYQLKLRRQTLGETRAVHDRLERDIRDAQQGIDKELQRAGLKDIEAVRAEVGEEVWERLVRDAEAEE
ncbi:hypothetical protein VD0004_g7697 [Verticillium dahliae]|uniref:Uncharacterized protein n=1 Tax=Verticillium dahliae TaxID=27337 RepID=A0A444S1E7_VERDA|nr:hypothetical protein VD0004_g7697 [Verticillium dahliae]PNH68209.1 hypothetical protein VD0001_g7565 [Verticillium dahliae]RXG47251.1 hypothetical protein VDGE_07061 [Verticillium dahliae]